MKNLISIYALLSSKVFQVILFILIICLLLPEDMSKYYAPIAAVGILLALGFGFCKLFNIPLGFFYFFGTLTTFIIGPYFGLTVLLIYLSWFFSYYSDPKNINLGTKKEGKTKPKKVKNPFTDNVNIDEPVTVEPFIKVRDAITAVGINTITPANLYAKLNEIENIAGMKIFRKETTSVQSLKELHTALTHIDLNSRETVTLQELFDVDEDDAYEYEKKYNPIPGKDYSKKTKKAKKEDLTTAESIGIVAGTNAALNYIDKKNRINKKKKEVEDLENEYRFEKGFDPDFDEDEGLSSNIKDEEKYLDARKQELREKNMSYDQYLTPEERDDSEE